MRGNIAAQTPAENTDSVIPAVTSSAPKVTPVDVDDDKPRVVMHYYDKHGDLLDEPVMFLATLDTVQKVKAGPTYPLYNGTTIGVNFGEAVMLAFGQKHANFDLWANVSLHNWLFPTIECGLGYANNTPDNNNYTYKSAPQFYAKIGLDYNFLYKSSPDYKFFVGVRAGFSHFKYDLNNVTISSDYWGETQQFSMSGLKSTAFYGEALAGLQVRIVKGFSLGWTLRWRFKFNSTPDRGSRPWFIPGYGTSPFGLSISAAWTISGKDKKESGEQNIDK